MEEEEVEMTVVVVVAVAVVVVGVVAVLARHSGYSLAIKAAVEVVAEDERPDVVHHP